ncbi:MAG TPA: histidine--tRNA ligase [Gemmatimonadales bacterium]|nr:histidine--tRNA ligase [Gemmatimonadales bacterium]
MQGKALPGFRDFYPEDLSLRNHIFATWRSVAARYGFEEYDGPPLEALELYTKKSGDEIVQQLYTFRDKGERDVALRPEMTPTLARMVAARVQALKKPVRWFSIPQLFRYERQQRGRLREHFQLNMDIIGEASPLADAELIAAAIDIMRAFGFGPADFKAKLSDRRLLRALLLGLKIREDKLPQVYVMLDKTGRGKGEPVSVTFGADFTVSGDRPKIPWEALGSLEGVTDFLKSVAGDVDAIEPLRQTAGALAAMGLADFVEVDLTIVRGLAYYTGIVFELFDTQHKLRAICGGGRYDGLLAAAGGPDLPALGFGMGDVVLGELLKERGVAPTASSELGAFLIPVGGDDLPTILQLAHALRERGISIEYGLRHAGVRKQLELASARGAARAVIVGPEERAAGMAVVRDLKSSTEAKVPIRQLLNGYFE